MSSYHSNSRLESEATGQTSDLGTDYNPPSRLFGPQQTHAQQVKQEPTSLSAVSRPIGNIAGRAFGANNDEIHSVAPSARGALGSCLNVIDQFVAGQSDNGSKSRFDALQPMEYRGESISSEGVVTTTIPDDTTTTTPAVYTTNTTDSLNLHPNIFHADKNQPTIPGPQIGLRNVLRSFDAATRQPGADGPFAQDALKNATAALSAQAGGQDAWRPNATAGGTDVPPLCHVLKSVLVTPDILNELVKVPNVEQSLSCPVCSVAPRFENGNLLFPVSNSGQQQQQQQQQQQLPVSTTTIKCSEDEIVPMSASTPHSVANVHADIQIARSLAYGRALPTLVRRFSVDSIDKQFSGVETPEDAPASSVVSDPVTPSMQHTTQVPGDATWQDHAAPPAKRYRLAEEFAEPVVMDTTQTFSSQSNPLRSLPPVPSHGPWGLQQMPPQQFPHQQHPGAPLQWPPRRRPSLDQHQLELQRELNQLETTMKGQHLDQVSRQGAVGLADAIGAVAPHPDAAATDEAKAAKQETAMVMDHRLTQLLSTVVQRRKASDRSSGPTPLLVRKGKGAKSASMDGDDASEGGLDRSASVDDLNLSEAQKRAQAHAAMFGVWTISEKKKPAQRRKRNSSAVSNDGPSSSKGVFSPRGTTSQDHTM
eukprot:GFYU01002240.1.p1 GENE.GFYU01002240.1~~GFYU01002240.1.p1  ORF type:complete len:649 (-),score=144.37 GFYU01002240.1:248-2194(-)